MKKFYAFSLMALAAATASAVAPVATIKSSVAKAGEFNKVIRTATEVSTPNRVAAKANAYDGETWNELGKGKYKASIMADYYSASDDFADVTVYEAEGKKGLYKVVGVWPDMLDDGTLIVDATDPEYVLVPNQNTGINDTVDGITYITSLSWLASDEYGFTKDVFIENFGEANAYETDGVIYFPVESLMLQWPEAPANSSYGTDPNEWYTGESEGCLVLPGANFVDPWSENIEATMVENILAPLFGATDETPYTVNLKINNQTGVIRISEPWKQLFKNLEFSSAGPDLELITTDPTNVEIELQSTGINGGTTDGRYYICSASFVDGEDVAEEEKITLTKNDEEGTTTITFPYHSTLVYAQTSQKLYYGSNAVNPSTITFKTPSTNGVSGVTIDNNDAPVEYFNLQGVRVENPAAGQLLIKRQGSEVSKTVIR
ncbi:MAG: hypothetical protein HDS77_03910 [Bacteroidales bacterium]|nr:hypothetical protein [Bacteroidales bacterium]